MTIKVLETNSHLLLKPPEVGKASSTNSNSSEKSLNDPTYLKECYITFQNHKEDILGYGLSVTKQNRYQTIFSTPGELTNFSNIFKNCSKSIVHIL